MQYVHIQTVDPVIHHAVKLLSGHLLSGEHVLWLLSGGSAIDIQVRIAQALQTLDVSRLQISLIDERYGPLGHKDENYQQLINAHFPFPITRVIGDDAPQKTTQKFGQFITHALKTADFSLGMFGIGPDGHTAGIKPHSVAVASTEVAVYYGWEDYHRITVTPTLIQQLNEAIIYATGSEKEPALRSLLTENLPLIDQPAQALKAVKKSTLYTDTIL